MRLKIILIWLAAVLVTGCASNPYKTPEGDASELATIRGYAVRTGLVSWENYWVDLIDNQSISYVFRDFEHYKIPVTPVKHSFVVFTEFNPGTWFGPCPCQTFVQINAALEAGREYELKGQVDGVLVKVWIEDATSGEHVTESSSAPYRPSPQEIYVPIFL